MTFEETVKSLKVGDVIDFKEYTLNRHERKIMTLHIEGGIIQDILQADVKLDRDTLEKYYGDELDTEDYLQLALMNCPRVVISLGLNERNEMDIKIITLNKDFFNMGLQVIETISRSGDISEPNYMSIMRSSI